MNTKKFTDKKNPLSNKFNFDIIFERRINKTSAIQKNHATFEVTPKPKTLPSKPSKIPV